MACSFSVNYCALRFARCDACGETGTDLASFNPFKKRVLFTSGQAAFLSYRKLHVAGPETGNREAG